MIRSQWACTFFPLWRLSRVLILATSVSQSFFTACLIWCWLVLTSTVNASVMLSCVFFVPQWSVGTWWWHSDQASLVAVNTSQHYFSGFGRSKNRSFLLCFRCHLGEHSSTYFIGLPSPSPPFGCVNRSQSASLRSPSYPPITVFTPDRDLSRCCVCWGLIFCSLISGCFLIFPDLLFLTAWGLLD